MKRCLPLVLLLIAACGKSKPQEGKAPPVTPGSAAGSGSAGSGSGSGSAQPAAAGLDLAGINKTVKPGDDFFRYANGTWLDKTEIPADKASYGTGGITVDLVDNRLKGLFEEAAKAPAGSEAKKIGDYYATFLDEAAIETKGVAPLQPELDAIAAIKDKKELSRALGATLRADVDAINNTNFETPNIFGVWVAQDLGDPSKYSVFLLQGGLELPSRDYYLGGDERMKALLPKYHAHIEAVLDLAKVPGNHSLMATNIQALETLIAQGHATHVESEDVKNGTNHWSRAELAKNAPGMDWDAFLDGAQLGKQQDFVIWHPKATKRISEIATQSLDTWKAWLAYHAIESAVPYLPKAFVDEDFKFFGTELAGTTAQRPRWKRASDSTSGALGEAVGKLYVEKYFPAAAKERISALVKNIMAAFERRIDALTWMAPATKTKAKAKLAALIVSVGYPDTWRDYTGLQVVGGDAFGNAKRAELFEYQRNLAKLGKPVDRKEWVMTPQLVNAVNLPAMNSLNFPAAILQAPYFDPNQPEAMDFGAVGAVIGHEISHSFDDQGALFDATGKLENWWTKEDLQHFQQQGKALADQYSAYKPFPDLAVNGAQTLSENIADVAGLAAAYDAFKASLGGKDAPAWEGLTGDQQFFLSFAQAWRTKYREPALRRRILTDGHAPGEYRADTVRNIDAWYGAFDVKPGEKLYLAPEARVHVW